MISRTSFPNNIAAKRASSIGSNNFNYFGSLNVENYSPEMDKMRTDLEKKQPEICQGLPILTLKTRLIYLRVSCDINFGEEFKAIFDID